MDDPEALDRRLGALGLTTDADGAVAGGAS
jgi:hypothetical protein